MSGKTTIKMIEAYYQDAEVTMFFSGFFRSPAQNFYNSEEVEIDIVRSGEPVAVVVQNIAAGYRPNVEDLYTNKKLKPPVYQESAPLNVYDLMSRMPGNTPFEDPNFQANAILRAFRVFRGMERKIRRAIELQAAQILQTGMLDLKDENGTTLYTLNYQPKATHFPTATIEWDANNNDPLADLASLANVIRTDGLITPDTLIFGETALDLFLKNATVKERLDNTRINIGGITPETRGQGATYHGFIWIGQYRYNIWTYDGRYEDPETGESMRYMDTNKVIMMSSQSRLDATFGAIPQILPPDSRLLQYLPPRMSDGGRGMDLHTNIWTNKQGTVLEAGVGARPLLIPTAIDQFGCITVKTPDEE